MRKITMEACRAFESGYDYKKGNMLVQYGEMFLHGNKIAKWVDGELWISNAGWSSNTTKERLNGLRGVSVCQRNFQWYLNGVKWNGEWVKVEGYGQEDKSEPVF